jgi:AraC family transcriptional regulator of adaptative response/methylated-DNA-[protein]-cysteine methyltransferase
MNNEQLMAQSIDWLVAHSEARPDLTQAASHVGMEPTSYQKLFTKHVGVSPKKFLEVMTYRRARDLLAGADEISTLDAAYDAGLSGNGRLHDLFVKIEAATPGEVKARGAGLTITYGFAPSPFGELIIARTHRGICWLGFQVDNDRKRCMDRIHAIWPNSTFVEDSDAIAADAAAVTAICLGAANAKKVPLHLFGTNFQLQVWQALLKIPSRHFLSYEGLGAAIGRPGSPRAIGNAVGANPVSLLIPCHRVIQKTGILNNYGWGSSRKKALLGIECAC